MVIVVLGSVRIQAGRVAEALQVSQAHVARSRLEPGCVEHGVSVDAEDPCRLVFVERWSSMAALQAHFAVPASRAFVNALNAVASEPPQMALYEASPLLPSAKRAG